MPEVGTVKWFDARKGWGFLVQEGVDEDIFVHYSNINGEGFRTLEDGEKVHFDLVKGDKGFQAENVRRVDSGEAPAEGDVAPAAEIEGEPAAESSGMDDTAHAGF